MGGMNYIVKPLQTLALASAFVVAAATYVQDAKALEGPSTSYNTIQVINYSPGQEVNGSHDSVSDDGLAFPGGTGEAGIESKYVGKIDIYDRQSYVAIERSMVDKAYSYLKNGKIKGRTFSAWVFDSRMKLARIETTS